MQRFKNWLITVLLRRDKLVAVPQSWQTEYVQLAGEKVRNRQAIGELITSYNELLKDYFKQCSVKEIQEELAEGKIKFKTTMSKDELVELAYNEFRMTVERF